MSIVMGLDQHRAQITAEWIDTETGEVSRTRVAPADRAAVRRFLERFAGQQLEVALEATTHAKSDRADARHLRELLMTGRLPECWISPDHILDLRARVRLRHSLVDERGEWQQRIRAVLYHHGLPRRSDLDLLTAAGRDWLTELSLSAATREQITIALRMIGALDTEIPAIDKQLRAYARRQTGCRALIGHYGIGELTSVAILAELGDCRRFSSSRYAVRYGGLDITVHASDRRRAPGHLSRQGPPVLRRALYEAAQAATRPSSPDHAYYRQAAHRLGHNRACIAIARNLLKRSYHTLKDLGDQALAPA
jgi:transposase